MKTPNLNGAAVDRSKDGSTIFIPLPRALWKSASFNPCACANCNGRPGFWDTLAVAAQREGPGHAADVAWAVHRPEEHPHHDIDEEGRRWTDPAKVWLEQKANAPREPINYGSEK